MLASYFPKPGNPLMGNWALSQAQSFRRAGMDVSVVSGTSWIPRIAARSAGAQAYACCPESYDWDGLAVSYPRWPLYPFGALGAVMTRFPAPLLKSAWTSVRNHLLAAVKQLRPDVVYAHHTQVNGYLAWRLREITGIPYVITDHDFGEIESCRTNLRRRRLYAPVAAASSRMVAVASRMAKLVGELFPGARTLTVQNGSDPIPQDFFRVPRPPELEGRTVIFSACAFYERKGIPLLVRGFSRIAAKYPSAILRIAGDGERRDEIEAEVRRANLDARIQLIGRLPHQQVLQEMVWADVFALPGWDEPFATAFTEALSAGCPIIYGADGGIADVVSDGEQGLAVTPRIEESLATALERVLGDERERVRMAAEARRLFDTRLHWDHNAARMKSVFHSALAERGQTRRTEIRWSAIRRG